MVRPLGVLFLIVICGARLGIAESESRFLGNIRQLTFQGKTGEGYFSPDGRHLVFQSVREPGNPFYQIYLLDFESGDINRVSPGTGKTTCAFIRPGANEILFASTHHDPDAVKKQQEEIAFRASGQKRRYSWDYDSNMDIFAADLNRTNFRQLTDAPGYDAEGAYSPDGNLIVFSSVRSAYPLEKLSAEDRTRYEMDPAYFADIYVMNADGSNQKRLTESRGYDGGPFFSADGERIIWRRFDEKGLIADVFSMKIDGSDVRQITRFESMSWAPYPHPSGEYIIFTSNKHGFENFELFLVDFEGRSEPVRVSFTPGFDGLPVFSPDGKKLCWTSNRAGESQLFLANWDHDAAIAALQHSQTATREERAPVQAAATADLSPEIKAADAFVHVSHLAADEMEGRKTGERGALQAARYIATQLKALNVSPLSPTNQNRADEPLQDYFQPFDFAAGVKVNDEQTRLSIRSAGTVSDYDLDEHFRPFSFSADGQTDAPVVFAGYGLSVPGKPGEGYDSYRGLEVSNKVVLVLRYIPEDVEPKRRQELLRYAGFRYKAMIARERGAKAILVVTGPNSPNAGKLVPLTRDGASGSDILAASISTEVAEKILAESGKSLKELQTALDTENPHAQATLVLTNTTVRLEVSLEHQRKNDRNVIAAIRGKTDEFIMVGAHYDHLGFGESSDSRSHAAEQGQIHNGADDNASGVAAVLELAGHFAAKSQPPNRGIIFAFWSGEEMGLIGSSQFAENPPLPLTNIVAYLNFDMVGRLRENKLVLQGAGSSPAWPGIIERRNAVAGFNATVQDDPYLPSDSTAFYPKGVPVLSFFTDSHDDYHRPTDDIETLNYEGIERITRFARLILQELINADTRPEYVKVDRSNVPGNRDALRVYIGTVPDYATEVQGVKLSGVRGGSPAEKAGLTQGDIVIEFAGQKIANIYDYTYAIDAAKIGQPIKIKVLRAGETVELTVTPAARQ